MTEAKPEKSRYWEEKKKENSFISVPVDIMMGMKIICQPVGMKMKDLMPVGCGASPSVVHSFTDIQRHRLDMELHVPLPLQSPMPAL